MNNNNPKVQRVQKTSADTRESIIKQLNEAELILVSKISRFIH